MAALRSPFYGENLNLLLLRNKIQALDYAPLPANVFSQEVWIFFFIILFYIVLYFLQLRHLVARCLVLNPDQRPDTTEISHIAQVMYGRFIEQTNKNNNTPTPTPSSRNDSAYGSITPVNNR